MDAAGLDAIARELCDLLQQQVESVVGRKFNDFTEEELEAYQRRKRRILLKSNSNGRLVIAQRDSGGGSSVLFPDPRVAGGDNRIRASQVTALPSESTWFKFDEHPG